MLKATFQKYELQFKRPAGTSRGVYKTRTSWIISVWHDEQPELKGYGECAPLPDLSCELDANYEAKLAEACEQVDEFYFLLDEGLMEYPSIRFGLETALMDLQNGGCQLIYDTPFAHNKQEILINGLIWMGDADYMREQIQEKLDQGFHCIKLKIGANDIEEELKILESIRASFPADQLELRVDANGAFSSEEVMPILERLAQLDIHSIEQPIAQGQLKAMRYLCKKSPLAIALDEELIGVHSAEDKQNLIKSLRPKYLILKPSLHGGMAGCEEWIEIANEYKVGWWITSALESNIGLNAIAQWVSSLNTTMPQGLGTGQLFTNNFPSSLGVKGEHLSYDPTQAWDLSLLNNA